MSLEEVGTKKTKKEREKNRKKKGNDGNGNWRTYVCTFLQYTNLLTDIKIDFNKKWSV